MTDQPTPADAGPDTVPPDQSVEPGADPAHPTDGTPDDGATPESSESEGGNPTPKAGRDLRAAIGVGLLLGALVVGSLLLDARAFLAVVTVAVAYGAWEVRRALTTKDIHVPVLPLMIGTVAMIVSAYARGAEALVLTFGLTIVGLLVWRIADGLAGAARDLAGGALVAFYPVFLAGFASLMLAEENGRQRIILFVIVTVFSDIGGYAAGVMLGKHPMAPSLSPKKSWEGFAGSVLACAAVGSAGMPLLLDGAWWAGALLGAVAAVGATLGDLVESSIKRDLGIKDMGTLLPGHGGLMDRLDSLVVVAPIAWALLHVFAPGP